MDMMKKISSKMCEKLKRDDRAHRQAREWRQEFLQRSKESFPEVQYPESLVFRAYIGPAALSNLEEKEMQTKQLIEEIVGPYYQAGTTHVREGCNIWRGGKKIQECSM